MGNHVAQFIFLAAGAIGLFAFLSAAAWAGAQASYRKHRDRCALLKSLAELPGDNAARVLEMLRADEERTRRRKEEEDRRGHLIGGLTCVSVGVALMIMLNAIANDPGVWTVGLIPLFIGLVLLPFGLRRNESEPPSAPSGR
jgi:hypothetical protein